MKILALDLGTTGNRAIVFDGGQRVVASAYEEFTQIYPRPGWVEAERQAGESLTRVSWSPHILNKNINYLSVLVYIWNFTNKNRGIWRNVVCFIYINIRNRISISIFDAL